MNDSIKREQNGVNSNSVERENYRLKSKQIETIKSGKNYSAVSVGKMNEIIEQSYTLPDDVEKDKISAKVEDAS